MKSTPRFAKGEHYVGMSSTARYFFDLGHVDSNWLTMLGGQDGSPGSRAYTDPIEHWNRQLMLKTPLNLATVVDTYKHCVVSKL